MDTDKNTKKQVSKKDDMRDAGKAFEERPVPSQAEGEEETADQELEKVKK